MTKNLMINVMMRQPQIKAALVSAMQGGMTRDEVLELLAECCIRAEMHFGVAYADAFEDTFGIPLSSISSTPKTVA